MNKAEWLWVTVRITGVIFFSLALISLPEILAAIYTISLHQQIPSSELTGSLDEATSITIKMYELQIETLIQSSVMFILYLVLSIYLVFGGKTLHQVLIRE